MYLATRSSASQSDFLGLEVFVQRTLIANAVSGFVLRMYRARPMPCLYLFMHVGMSVSVVVVSLSCLCRYVVDIGVLGVVKGSVTLKKAAILSMCAGCASVMYLLPCSCSYVTFIPMKCSRLFSSILYFVLSAAYSSSRSSCELLAIAKSSTCVRKMMMSPGCGPRL